MNATRSVLDLNCGGGPGTYPSRTSDSFRSCVSSRCAATCFTVQARTTVCASHSAGPSDFNNSISRASTTGSKCATRIGPGNFDAEGTEFCTPLRVLKVRSVHIVRVVRRVRSVRWFVRFVEFGGARRIRSAPELIEPTNSTNFTNSTNYTNSTNFTNPLQFVKTLPRSPC